MAMQNQKQTFCSVSISLLVMGFLVTAIFAPAAYAQNLGASENLQESQSAPENISPPEKIESKESYTEDLILAVYTGNQLLSSGIYAVEQNGRFYLPISELANILGYKVTTNLETRNVTGEIREEGVKFTMSPDSNFLKFGSEEIPLPDQTFLDASVADDDVYILLGVLSEIWPLELNINFSSLTLRVTPDDLLPFQANLKRKEKQKLLQLKEESDARAEENAQGVPFIAKPYQLFGMPSIDLSGSAGYDARTDALEYNTALTGVQDLGYASADYSVQVSQNNNTFNKPDNIRLRFTRENIHDGALPLGLEQVRWGDINLINRDLIANGRQGRGAKFTTRETKYLNEFDSITVDGIGVPGYEAELYINNELIDFGVVDDRGEYRFENVSIGYGNNRIRVVLYGPQGQLVERVENYFYQSNMVAAGTNEFSGGIVDSERDLIPIDKRPLRNRAEGLAANIYTARGITDKLTVFATANTIKDKLTNDFDSDSVSREYLTAGAIGSLGSNIAQVEGYKQLDGGSAFDVRTLSDFKGFKINTKTAMYSDFDSPDADVGNSRKEFEFDFNVKKIISSVIGALGLEAGLDYLKREDGTENTNYTTRQSLGIGGTSFTHQTSTSVNDGDHQFTNARVNSTTRMRNWRLRNSLGYNIYPDLDVTTALTELRYKPNEDFTTAFRLSRNFDSDETVAGFQVSRDFDKFLGSFETDWSSRFGTSFLFRASTSLGPYGKNDDYIMQSEPLRNAGPISTFVFNDKDYDGVFTEGDEPIEGAKIAFGRRKTKDETDAEGYLTEINPSAGGKINVSVENVSIDDPYIIAGSPGYRIHPRPGVIHRIDLPVIETGAIDGTLSDAQGDPISGLKLELLKDDSSVVQSSTTAPDGYFTFERIPPGSYTIRAAPDTGLNIPFAYVDLKPDDMFKFGVDMTAVDLNQAPESDLGVTIANDGLLKADSIISLVKGLRAGKAQKQNAGAKIEKVSSVGTASSANVSAVRVGEHSNKIRMVLDLSGQTQYSISTDPATNMVIVDMPNASWSASQNWQSKSGRILNNYRAEKSGNGTKLMLDIDNGVSVGANGLLKPFAGKTDRLYIDLENK